MIEAMEFRDCSRMARKKEKETGRKKKSYTPFFLLSINQEKRIRKKKKNKTTFYEM